MTPAPLSIVIHSARRGQGRVSIRSSRPVGAARLLENRSVSEALTLLPRLYSVCAQAQLRAGRQALSAAAGETNHEQVRDRELVLLETAREHLWRVLIDWPALLETAADPAQLAALGSFNQTLRSVAAAQPSSSELASLRTQLTDLLRSGVFGRPPVDWVALDCEALAGWSREVDTPAARLVGFLLAHRWEDAGATEPRFLPPMANDELNQRLNDDESDEFVAFPEWEGETRETTPLLRQQHVRLVKQALGRWGAGALTRVVALLAELARIPEQLDAGDAGASGLTENQLPARTGLSQIDAARGRLVHRAVLDGQHIERYQVLAPTEWNCHPRGVLARSLSALDSRHESTLRRQAALLVTAIDPCVGYSLEVH